MNPRALAEVDVVTLEQKKKERIERLVWSHLLCAQPECPALASIPHPILKCSSGCRCCQGTGPAVDLLHVPCQGYDPDAKAAFQPKAKQKGRSSKASLVKRKKKVMDQEHRVCELGRVLACTPAALSAYAQCLTLLSHLVPGQSPAEP